MTEERRKADDFASELGRIFGDELVSVLLYGSAARGEYRAGISDLNLLVILRDLGVEHLRNAASATRRWVSEGNPPPLLLSSREWQGSADVFPLEYSDIRDSHLLLVGRDPFAAMKIHREHLRLQVEHELRSKKIQLREAYLVSGESPEEIGQLLIRSVSTFLAIFRGILRLEGSAVPSSAAEVVTAVAGLAGFEAAPVLAVLDARRTGERFAPTLNDPTAAGYLEAVERTVAWLDDAGLRTHLEAEV
jgi:hypothetical protein